MSTIFKSPLTEFSEDNAKLQLLNVYNFKDLSKRLSKIQLRGTYDVNSNNIEPYKDISFTLETIYPPETAVSLPQVTISYAKTPLYTAQPYLYDV